MLALAASLLSLGRTAQGKDAGATGDAGADASGGDAGADAGGGDAGSVGWCERSFLAPFASFLGHEEARAWSSAADPGEGGDDERGRVLREMAGDEVLVATVPDPIDSSLVYQFDQILRAVEAGVERAGYLRDAMRLPWEDRRSAAPESRAREEACRLEVPGVRIFRPASTPPGGAGDARRARIVLFVGETPSEGVHKEALLYALRFARDLRAPALRLVGPTFSGSARSIAEVLDAAYGEAGGTRLPKRVRIVSGAATLKALPGEFAALPGVARAGASIDFRFTTLDDVTTEQLFFAWLRDRDGLRTTDDETTPPRLAHVGLLVESGTAYGQLDECAATPDAGAGMKGAFCPEVVLRFDRGVAQLQHAYAQAERAGAATASQLPQVPPQDLDPDLDERSTPGGNDAPPHPKALAAADLELRNLVSEVAREGLRYLAIRATDAGDAIFLANRVRDVAPNVRLIFLGSDVLYLHPHFKDDLRGSYVVSAYPFFGTSDFSSLPSLEVHTHRPWSSQGAEGVYNAALAVFDDGAAPGAGDALLRELSEYAPFSTADGGRGCGSGTALLPLWVTVIGNGAPLPIDAVLPDPGCRGDLYDPCDAGAPPRAACAPGPAKDESSRLVVDADVTPPHGWRLSLYLIVVVLAFHFLFGVRALDARAAREVTPTQLVYRAQHMTYAVARGAVLFAAFTYMVAVHSLSLNAYRWRSDGVDGPWGIGSWRSLAWGVFVLAALVLCGHGVLRAWRAIGAAWTGSQASGRARLWSFARALVPPLLVAAGSVVLLVVMGAIDASRFAGGGRIAGVAYTLRALPLGSGASSALVVVLIAGAVTLWLTDRMRRLRLSYLLSWCSPAAEKDRALAGIERVLPTPIGDIVGEEDVKALESRVQMAIDRSTSDVRSLGRSALVLAVPLLALLVQRPTTVDGAADGTALVLLVAGVMVLLAITLQHLAEFHVAFRRLLRRLRTWPLAAALDQAPGIAGATVLQVLTRNVEEVEPFAACVVVAGRVGDEWLAPEARAALDAELRAARRAGRRGLTSTHLGERLVEAARATAARLSGAPLPFPDGEGKARHAPLPAGEAAVHRLVGCVVAVLLEVYVRHVRYFVRGVCMPTLLLIGVLGSYPFEPHRLFLAGAWILVLALGAVSVWVYLGLERDVVLSKVSGTPTNTIPLNRELLVTVLTVVVLPLLSIFAAQYPDVGRVVLRVFDPFSSVLK